MSVGQSGVLTLILAPFRAVAMMPEWLTAALGAYAMFKAGNVVMVGAVAWLLDRDPDALADLPSPGWPWLLNVALWLGGGLFLTVQSYKERQAVESTEAE